MYRVKVVPKWPIIRTHSPNQQPSVCCLLTYVLSVVTTNCCRIETGRSEAANGPWQETARGSASAVSGVHSDEGRRGRRKEGGEGEGRTEFVEERRSQFEGTTWVPRSSISASQPTEVLASMLFCFMTHLFPICCCRRWTTDIWTLSNTLLWLQPCYIYDAL